MRKITILHTNDLHGKLMSSSETIIGRERKSVDAALLLDAGDAVTSGNIYYRPRGEPILSRMSALSYDAMAMGNREFHFLAGGLESKLRLAEFPVLCANIRSDSVDMGSLVTPYIVKDIGGVRVGIFGLTVPMITRQMLASKLSSFVFEDPITAATAIVPGLRADCDLLLALTHIGIRRDIELAQSVPGIDLIVGGHSHTLQAEPLQVNGAYILQAGWWGHFLGSAVISVSADGIASVESKLIDLRAD